MDIRACRTEIWASNSAIKHRQQYVVCSSLGVQLVVLICFCGCRGVLSVLVIPIAQTADVMRIFRAVLLVVGVILCFMHNSSADHHKIARFVVKKAVKKLLKNPVIPVVLPLPIIKHQPKPVVHHEIINVHEPPKIIHKPVFVKEVHHEWDEGWDNKW